MFEEEKTFISFEMCDKHQVICQSITKDYEFVIGIRCQPRVEIVLP